MLPRLDHNKVSWKGTPNSETSATVYVARCFGRADRARKPASIQMRALWWRTCRTSSNASGHPSCRSSHTTSMNSCGKAVHAGVVDLFVTTSDASLGGLWTELPKGIAYDSTLEDTYLTLRTPKQKLLSLRVAHLLDKAAHPSSFDSYEDIQCMVMRLGLVEEETAAVCIQRSKIRSNQSVLYYDKGMFVT